MNVLQKHCLLTDPNVSINTELINTEELQLLMRPLCPPVGTGGPQPSVATYILTNFKNFARHPSLPKVIKLGLMSRTFREHPPSQSSGRAGWGTWICNLPQILHCYKEAEANLTMYLPAKAPLRDTRHLCLDMCNFKFPFGPSSFSHHLFHGCLDYATKDWLGPPLDDWFHLPATYAAHRFPKTQP